MRYMLLIYNNPAALQSLPEAELNRIMGEVEAIMAELTDTGEMIGGAALADSSHTKTVRVRDGLPIVTDGPYAEAKEQLAGYITIETDDPKRAVDVAARWPDARYWWMEVRPVMDESGSEM